MNKKKYNLEIVIYACAGLIVLIFSTHKNFANDYLSFLLLMSGALVMFGIVITALALLWRRIKIWKNRNKFGDKAEEVESSVEEVLASVIKGVAVLWLLLVVGGFFEKMIQHI